MQRPGDAVIGEMATSLGADAVLGQAEAGVVVTDRLGNLQYANSFAVRLFGFPDDPGHLVGRSLLSLGFEEGDLRKASELAGQVLRGRAWEGTFAILRADGTRALVRAQAVPLRPDGGEITGIVIMAREATRRGILREREQLGLLERIGERLAGSLELGVTLRQVAETLVPQFADHCLIDLLQGDKAGPPGAAARQGLDAGTGHLGHGRRADPVPGWAFLPAGDGADGHGHRGGPGRPRRSPRRAGTACRRATRSASGR